MGEYIDAMKRMAAREYEFSTEKQPKIKMRVVTKIERVQPCSKGINKKGELVWEGREMPRWQQELFRKQYHISKEEFGHFWDHMAQTEGQGGGEAITEKDNEPYWAIASKDKIKQWKKWAELVRDIKAGRAHL